MLQHPVSVILCIYHKKHADAVLRKGVHSGIDAQHARCSVHMAISMVTDEAAGMHLLQLDKVRLVKLQLQCFVIPVPNKTAGLDGKV